MVLRSLLLFFAFTAAVASASDICRRWTTAIRDQGEREVNEAVIAANIDVLKLCGFAGCADAVALEHPESGLRLVPTRPGELPPGAAAGFVYRQRIPGRTTVLDPKWMAEHDVASIHKNIDEIIRQDLYPALVIDLNKPTQDIVGILRHEGIHYNDAQLPEGKMRVAIQLAGADTHAEHLPTALAYDIFTEMRAYGADGHPGVAPIVGEMQKFIADNPTPTAEQRKILVINATAFCEQLFPTVAHHYVDKTTGRPVRPTQAQLDAAGPLLADLMIRYQLTPRVPKLTANR